MNCVIFAVGLQQTLTTAKKIKKQEAWDFRFACEKVFDFAVDTFKALQWNQPAAAENSSQSINWQTHICALKTYKCAMQRTDRWVTGFQKHQYGRALWHNKRSPSAHTYFLCLCPMGRPAFGLLEKISASGARSVKDNTDEMQWWMYNFEIILFYYYFLLLNAFTQQHFGGKYSTFESTMKWYILEPDKN